MKRVLIAGSLALAMVGALGSFGFVRGWHVSRVTPRELSTRLRQHDTILRPDGKGPFPVVLMFHGCGGIGEGDRDWARWFRDRGFLVVMVDSLAARGIGERWQEVCEGKILWGRERAGDVLVSLADVKSIAGADPSRVVLAGWSHGAWAIMDLFALGPPEGRPTNLTEAPPLDGVAGAVLMYPYCGFGVLSGGGWEKKIPSLMLLAGNDTVVPTPACEKLALALGIEHHSYPGIDHCFDMPTEKDSKLVYVPAAAEDARRRVAAFLDRVIAR